MANKKTSSSKKAKKTTPKKAEPAPAPAPVVEETPVVEPAPVEPEQTNNYDSEFTDIQNDLKSALTLVKSLTSRVAKLEKRVQRDRKVMDKKMKGRVKRVVDPNKPPSGFAKPGPVSTEPVPRVLS